MKTAAPATPIRARIRDLRHGRVHAHSEMLPKISGNPLWADRCEDVAFNSLPAALTPDLKALHYLTGANIAARPAHTKPRRPKRRRRCSS